MLLTTSMRPQYALRATRLLRRYYSSNASSVPAVAENHLWGSETFDSRVEELKAHYNGKDVTQGTKPAMYPRMPQQKRHQEILEFRTYWQEKEQQGSWDQVDNSFTVQGRVNSVRRHGKKLAFLNISQGGSSLNQVQVMCSLGSIESNEATKEKWNRFIDTVKPGDVYCKSHFVHSHEQY
jgi:lysyl-tRNA synthetase class II